MIGLRRIFSQAQTPLRKYYSTGSKLVEVTHNNETGTTVLSLARPPANSLNIELLDALKTSLIDAQKNRSKGVILTSSLPTIFSAGLDILEMYNQDEKRLNSFWNTLQDMWLTLYSLEIPVAAAINGASPAGGCMLAISCEYRVFVEGKHTMGLNETQLGIAAPTWFKDTYVATIGYRNAELALLRGALFSPEKALQIGLVDELASNKADAIKKCEDYISLFKRIPYNGRNATKLTLRKGSLVWLKENREWDLKQFLAFVQLPEVQAGLKLYMQSLKQK